MPARHIKYTRKCFTQGFVIFFFYILKNKEVSIHHVVGYDNTIWLVIIMV